MISRTLIQSIGESVGITKLKEGVTEILSNDVEQRIRELIKTATKFMKHSSRDRLTHDDMAASLDVNNVESLYGYSPSTSESVSFRHTTHSTDDLFYLDDTIIPFDTLLNQPLPKCPHEATFSIHWLAIDGIQPKIVQNPSQITLGAAAAAAQGEEAIQIDTNAPAVQTRPVVKHVLSKEQQMYYEHVTAAIKGTDDILKKAALRSVGSDEGLHQLLPYFTQFIAEQVTHNLRNLPLLRSLMSMAHCLLTSTHLHVEPYLHQLMPSILTCLVGKRLCHNPSEDHWSLRDYCSQLVALVCEKFGAAYRNLQPRVTKTLVQAFLDPSKPLTTHYGAIVGLARLGHNVVRTLILPYLSAYLSLLTPVLEDSSNPIKRGEATNCYGALLHAVGNYVRYQWKEMEHTHAPVTTTTTGKDSHSESIEEFDDDDAMTDVKLKTEATSAATTVPTTTTMTTTTPSTSSTSSASSRKRKLGSMSSIPVPSISDPLDVTMNELFELFGESLAVYTQARKIPSRKDTNRMMSATMDTLFL